MATIEDFRAWYDRDLGRWAPWDKSVHITRTVDISDHREIDICIFTEKNRYSIKVREPQPRTDILKSPEEQVSTAACDGNLFREVRMDSGYLGCIATSRRWRAGEDWHRGFDMWDGPFTEEAWGRVMGDIVGFELVEVTRDARPRGGNTVANPYPHPSAVPPSGDDINRSA